jgi:hypothetical protein
VVRATDPQGRILDFLHRIILHINNQKNPWPESAGELYLPSDRRLSAKLVPTYVERGRRVDSATDPHGRILGFLDRIILHINNHKILRLSPRAKLVPTFADRVCHVVSVTDPYGRNLCFLDRSRYCFFKVAPQLYSRG